MLTFASLSLGVVVSCATVSQAALGPTGSDAPDTAATATSSGVAKASPTASLAAELLATAIEVPTPVPTASSVTLPAPTPSQRVTAAAPSTSPWPTTARASVAPAASIVPQASVSTAASAPPTAAPTKPRKPSLGAATERRLTRILRDMVRKKDVAGLQVAVRLPDGTTWVGTDGNAEFSPPRPLEDDTVFAIASVSKTFIAALILQLAEEGSLSIDDLVVDYVPDAPKAKIATIRNLLSHTSGIYNYFEHPQYAKAATAWLRQQPAGGLQDREHQWTYEEILGLLKKGYCDPGICYHYSNTNYVILGKVAEVAGGAPLHKQLRQRFVEPLGLTDTYYQPAEKPPLDAAHGHWDENPFARGSAHIDHTRDSRVLPFMGAVTAANAAGAMASTARDLTIWADALYGGEVLSSESLRQMMTMLPEGLYGLGTDVAVFAGHRAYGHRGGLRGFESSMWYFPKADVSIALLSNRGNWLTDAAMLRIVKAVLGKA